MGKMETPKDQLDQDIKSAFSKAAAHKAATVKCPVEETLAAYAEGRLSPDQVGSIEEHMVSCSKCTEEVLSLSASLRSEDTDVYGAVSEGTLHRVKGMMHTPASQPMRSRLFSWVSVFGSRPAWAMASVLLVVAAYSVYHSQMADRMQMRQPLRGRITLIAGMPSTIVTRGEAPVYEGVGLAEGATLRSGDSIRIEFSLESEGFAYLFLLGSTGKPSLLYPSEDAAPGVKLSPHTTISLPAENQWYQLDENPGDETIYLIISASAIEDIHQRAFPPSTSRPTSVAELFPDASVETFRLKHE